MCYSYLDVNLRATRSMYTWRHVNDSDRIPVLCNVVLEGPENVRINAYMSNTCLPLSVNSCGNTIKKTHLKRFNVFVTSIIVAVPALAFAEPGAKYIMRGPPLIIFINDFFFFFCSSNYSLVLMHKFINICQLFKKKCIFALRGAP